jgi:hypothetical protein
VQRFGADRAPGRRVALAVFAEQQGDLLRGDRVGEDGELDDVPGQRRRS